ncbi:TPA: class II glutamine amidotransferase [Klebsiella aerogenes]
MCELLGMSANVPTDICFSFSGLVQRGAAPGRIKTAGVLPFTKGKGVAHLKIRSRAFSRQ